LFSKIGVHNNTKKILNHYFKYKTKITIELNLHIFNKSYIILMSSILIFKKKITAQFEKVLIKMFTWSIMKLERLKQ